MNKIWVGILIIVAGCGIFTALVANAVETRDIDPGVKIYLVSHGWHAGLVLRKNNIPEGVWSPPKVFNDVQYLEVGWGDLDFYRTPEPHFWLILKAALQPTDSVLHVVGFSGSVLAYFPYSEIIEIELSDSGFENLVRSLATKFAKDEAGNVISLGYGLYGNSRFYKSGERYHLFNTCNVWTAGVLRDAGLSLSPARAITVKDLMSQVRKYGNVVNAGPNTMPQNYVETVEW